ncbi:MAG: hypothetical protein ACYTEZ_04365 [Planctomycetota bacterium]|jgi:hypothetical protein
MRRLWLIALLLCPTQAQEKQPAAPPEPATRPDQPLEVRLQSGTVLVGRVEPAEWQVRTAFGALTVPVANVRFVRFGRRANPERLRQVRESIRNLGSANPDRRNHARASLKEEGAFAFNDLKAAAKDHEDPEVRRLCQEILDELDIAEEEVIPDDDEIQTTKFNLSGTIELQAFRIAVPELGALNVRRSDIVHIRSFKPSRVKKLSVTGDRMWPNGWVDSKIKVRKGQKLHVTAEGVIHFPNWGQAFSPDGNPRMGNINGYALGTLAARIGDKGPLFRVGSNYTLKAKAAGTLQFIVMLQVHGQPSTGEYTVKVDGGER